MTARRGSGAQRFRSTNPSKSSLEHSERHIEALYEISKQLTRFGEIDAVLPEIIDIIATTLPIRTAICIQQRDEEFITWTWSSRETSAEDVLVADQKAKSVYDYLTGSSPAGFRTFDAAPQTEPAAKVVEFDQGTRTVQLLTLPLVVERAPTFGIFQLGALFMEPAGTLDKVDVAFVNAVANQLAIAIDRRRVWEQLLQKAHAETTIAQSKQIEAELAEKREHLLAEASALLGRSLDYNSNIEAFSRLLVPTLADWCMIDMVATTEPEIVRVASTIIVHTDETKESICREIVRRSPQIATLDHGLSYVLRTGQSEIHPDVSQASWIPVALGVEYPHLLQQLGARSYMCVPLKGRGGIVGAITFIYDESGRRYGPVELQLAENFAWRAAAAIDNARLYEGAQKAIRVRDDLLGIVSHDLRNPLGLIVLHAASLLKRSDALPSGACKQIDGIQRSAERMTRLIEDLLDSVSIEAGRVSIQPQRLPIVSVVNGTIEAFEPLAIRRTLRLEADIIPDVPAVFADPTRLQQILANLVSNAIKFTPVGGCVRIRIEEAGDFVKFAVSDTGPGIPEDELPHVFDRFWQARRTAGLGTGLGLFISRGLVEMQGGKLWVESTLGQGTTFFFTLPVASATDPQPPPVDTKARADAAR